jgi:hypothetical protein
MERGGEGKMEWSVTRNSVSTHSAEKKGITVKKRNAAGRTQVGVESVSS